MDAPGSLYRHEATDDRSLLHVDSYNVPDVRVTRRTLRFHAFRIAKSLIVKRLSGSIKSGSVGLVKRHQFDSSS